MFTLYKQFRFEASHQLAHHDGKCARLHGHSWVMTIEIQGDRLCKTGAATNMLFDFGGISSIVKPVIDKLFDHHHLNTTLRCSSPTSEFIAQWWYKKLQTTKLKRYLSAVLIGETCTSECEYREGVCP